MARRVSPKLLRNLPYVINNSVSNRASKNPIFNNTSHFENHQHFNRFLNSSPSSLNAVTTPLNLTHQIEKPISNTSSLSLDDVERLFSSVSTTQLVRSLVNLHFASIDPIVDLGIWVMRSRLIETPICKEIILATVKHTFYEHFCAGENLNEASKTLQKLWDDGLRGILDYGLEDAIDNKSCDGNLNEFLKAVESTKMLPPCSVSYACVKITAICPISLLKRVSDLLRWEYKNPSFKLPWKMDTLPILADSSPFYHTLEKPEPLTPQEEEDLRQAYQRLLKLSEKCFDLNLPLLVDAEYTSVQPAIDYLTYSSMIKFNKDSNPIVYGTVQTYLKDAKERTIQATEAAAKMGITMGLKLVRGAYLSSESKLASSLGYASPIHGSIQETHACYNECATFMIEKVSTGTGAVVLATHNLESGKVAAAKAQALGIGKGNPNLQFAQLKGMAEGLSFGLRNAGFQVSKYLPYGPVEMVIPYLLRRAEENRGLLSASTMDRVLMRDELVRRLKAAVWGGGLDKM
ncbi:Proline dehydrogenase 1 protein [Thalictrum thalictroides]|uniref:Proline dehydrogenase n=1 Tax=Thalictrum thalictroides TaxID=46969 RepID=A0A7J6V9U1_THATH|nr:Proline dehydrogenase 1 protein [Thalictrum thalictroides]